jgi:hypothetical protein
MRSIKRELLLGRERCKRMPVRSSRCYLRGLPIALTSAVVFLAIVPPPFSGATAKPGSPQGLPPANLCDTPEHHQFDFWVGDWDVFRTDTNALVARSHIEKLYAGCALGEHWMPLQGTGGGSLNSYRPYLKRWVQVWTDSGNNFTQFAGGWDGKQMKLAGTSVSTSGQRMPVRMTYERMADGSVVQTGYQGKPSKIAYELVYRRAPAQH